VESTCCSRVRRSFDYGVCVADCYRDLTQTTNACHDLLLTFAADDFVVSGELSATNCRQLVVRVREEARKCLRPCNVSSSSRRPKVFTFSSLATLFVASAVAPSGGLLAWTAPAHLLNLAREEAKSVPVLLFVSTSVRNDEARCPAVYASLLFLLRR